MTSTTIQVDDRAYLIMHLHAIKYHNFDCVGALIGTQTKNGNNVVVKIQDCVPLFHQRVTSGTCEIAFDMIQNCVLEEGQQIVGLCEAALPTSLSGGREQTQLAQYLCEIISSNFKDAIFVQVKADMAPSSDDTPQEDQLAQTKGLLFKWFTVNSNGSIQHLDKNKISGDGKCSDTAHVCQKYVQNSDKTYLKLYDFDDHFSNVAMFDFRN